jgi:hypothetical protein
MMSIIYYYANFNNLGIKLDSGITIFMLIYYLIKNGDFNLQFMHIIASYYFQLKKKLRGKG